MLILCVMPKRCHSPWRAGSDPIRTRGQAWSTEWAARYPQPSLSCPRGSPTGTTSTVFSNTVSQKQGIVGEHHSVCCCREADGAAAGTAPQEFSSPHRDRAAEGQETSEEAWLCTTALLALANVTRIWCWAIQHEIRSPDTEAGKWPVHFQGHQPYPGRAQRELQQVRSVTSMVNTTSTPLLEIKSLINCMEST